MTRRSNGEGTVYQRKDGRWAGVATVEGKRRFVYGHSRGEAATKLIALQATVNAGEAVPPTRYATGDLLARWLDAVRPTIRPSTYVSYESHVRLHLGSIAPIPVAKLTAKDIRALQTRLLAAGLAPRTVGYTNTILRMAFRWGQGEGLVGRNVPALVEPPRVPVTAMRPLTASELATLLTTTTDPVRRALYALCGGCGLRLGEALGLGWRDVVGRTITVRHSLRPLPGQPRGSRLQLVEPKTPRARRTVVMPAFVRSILDDVPHRAEQVLSTERGTFLDPRNAIRLFKADLAAAGLPDIRLHDLRHTYGTLQLQAGTDLQTLRDSMGHTSIATTSIYLHSVPSLKEAAADALDRLVTDEP